MALLFTVKKGARLPSVELTLTSTATYDLASATSVNFVYREHGVAERVVIALVVTDAPNKKVRLDLPTFNAVKRYQCHVEVTIGGLVMCFPHKDFDEFAVTPTIDAP